jgi:hypothetical protein
MKLLSNEVSEGSDLEDKQPVFGNLDVENVKISRTLRFNSDVKKGAKASGGPQTRETRGIGHFGGSLSPIGKSDHR